MKQDLLLTYTAGASPANQVTGFKFEVLVDHALFDLGYTHF